MLENWKVARKYGRNSFLWKSYDEKRSVLNGLYLHYQSIKTSAELPTKFSRRILFSLLIITTNSITAILARSESYNNQAKHKLCLHGIMLPHSLKVCHANIIDLLRNHSLFLSFTLSLQLCARNFFRKYILIKFNDAAFDHKPIWCIAQ